MGKDNNAVTEDVVDDTLSVDKVEEGRTGALTDNKDIYYGTDGKGGLIGDTNAAYDKAGSQFVIDPDDGFTSAAEMQIANQNASYQQTVTEIGQAKDQAQKDYTKEQTGSYVDYMKGIDPFGVNAEQMAAMGISQSGYNENSKVQAYVAYQNRVAVARESFNRIMLDYANQMERARIANDAAIAQIYASSAQQLAALEIERVAAVGQLVGQYQASANDINTRYDGLWKDTLDSIYKDKTFDEEVRMNNETIKQQNRDNIESTILTTGVIPSEAALEAAGMTMDEAKALQGRYQTETAAKQTTATNEAQQHVLALIQGGAKPTASQIEAAGWTQEYIDSLNALYNPTINKGQQNSTGVHITAPDVSRNVDAYLANDNMGGAEAYLSKMLKDGEISKEEYQELYYNMAMNNEVTVENIGTNIDMITKWKNSGKLSAADAASLTSYYYGQIGASSDKAGVKLERIEGGASDYYYKYKGTDYLTTYANIDSDTKSILNGIATGSGGKTPAHGTVVMYNGKLYVYDNHVTKHGFWGRRETANTWKEIYMDSAITGNGQTIKEALTKYSNTHEVASPEHSNNTWTSYKDAANAGFSNIMTEGEYARRGGSGTGTNSYAEYLAKMYKKYVG